ncbi:Immunity protein 8 [compost metagenome]
MFFLNLRLSIGIEDADGADDFELVLCTPTWLERNVWEPLWGRHFLIVRDFNCQSIFELVSKKISQCDGDSWLDVGGKLAREILRKTS